MLLVLVVGAGIYAYVHRRAGDVVHPHARFVPEATPRPGGPDRFTWPLFGYVKDHTRYFPADSRLHPPFVSRWLYNGHSLLEFPPVISGATIYQLNDSGVLLAIAKSTGRIRWTAHLGVLAASTPAASGDTVYVTILDRAAGIHAGRVVALRQRDGAIRWSRDLPSRSESSPLLDRGRLYFGSESGAVYALRSTDGRVQWTYHAHGAVKASPTYRDGTLYFGDYGGHVQAVRESDGRLVWSTQTNGTLFGAGTFYSTAAAVYGRVYLGNTDGRVYAFDARDGKLDWAKQTGAYVYSSPAVTDVPGLGPTVFLGSYDGRFYALDARDGRVRWSYNAHGRISGSPTIIGHIVYFADLGTRTTIGLGTRYGSRLFSKQTGSFDPVISDGRWIFLTGYTSLYALEPRALLLAQQRAARGAHPRPPGTRPAPRPSPPRPASPPPRRHTPQELCRSRACKIRTYRRYHHPSARQRCQSLACRRRFHSHP